MVQKPALVVIKKQISRISLLNLLNAGLDFLVVATGPNVLRYDSSYHQKIGDDYYSSSITKAVNRLYRHGHVKIVDTKDGQVVKITDKGKTELLKYNLESIEIPIQNPWDGQWRMVFFDIDAKGCRNRFPFQRMLRKLGFFQMQKSVYIYPYPCADEIKYLREIYNIPHSVKLATINDLENDVDIRKKFGL
jgi:DNA-binding transcriptional regulator PaaX